MQTTQCTAAETQAAILADREIRSGTVRAALITLLALEYPQSTTFSQSLRATAMHLGYADARPLARAVKVGVKLGHLVPTNKRVCIGGPWVYQCAKRVS